MPPKILLNSFTLEEFAKKTRREQRNLARVPVNTSRLLLASTALAHARARWPGTGSTRGARLEPDGPRGEEALWKSLSTLHYDKPELLFVSLG